MTLQGLRPASPARPAAARAYDTRSEGMFGIIHEHY
jgi:hypothetical protein